MLGLNLEDATDWQRNLFAHTHVFDNQRTGTVLLFDQDGNPASSLHARKLHPFPIQSFAPGQHDATLEHAKDLYVSYHVKGKGVDTFAANTMDAAMLKAFARRILLAAAWKLKQRPSEHPYTATPLEQLQMLKVFVEANKYPALTSQLFNETYGRHSPTVLVTYPHRDSAEPLLHTNSAAGYYSGRHNLVGIANAHPAFFRYLAAEEFFHALDEPDLLVRRNLGERDIQELSTQASHVLHTYFADKFALSSVRKTDPDSFNMQDFRDRVAEARQKRPEHFAYSRSLHSVVINGHYLLDEYRILKHISNFHKSDPYKHNPQGWDAELFAKLASHLALRRHLQRNCDVTLERRVERQLYGATQAGKVAITALDMLERMYEAQPKQERDRAERFAQQAAETLDALLPNSGKYMRSGTQRGSVGR